LVLPDGHGKQKVVATGAPLAKLPLTMPVTEL
jgi:hypothetical protein